MRIYIYIYLFVYLIGTSKDKKKYINITSKKYKWFHPTRFVPVDTPNPKVTCHDATRNMLYRIQTIWLVWRNSSQKHGKRNSLSSILSLSLSLFEVSCLCQKKILISCRSRILLALLAWKVPTIISCPQPLHSLYIHLFFFLYNNAWSRIKAKIRIKERDAYYISKFFQVELPHSFPSQLLLTEI